MNLNNFLLCGHSTFYFYPNLVSDGRLLYFHFLALINNATVNIQVHVFVCTFYLFCIHIEVELLGQMVTMSNLLRNCQTVFQSNCPILHSDQQMYKRSVTITARALRHVQLLATL